MAWHIQDHMTVNVARAPTLRSAPWAVTTLRPMFTYFHGSRPCNNFQYVFQQGTRDQQVDECGINTDWSSDTIVYWLASNEVLAVLLVVSHCTHRGHPDDFSGLAAFRIFYLDVEARDEGIQTYRHT